MCSNQMLVGCKNKITTVVLHRYVASYLYGSSVAISFRIHDVCPYVRTNRNLTASQFQFSDTVELKHFEFWHCFPLG